MRVFSPHRDEGARALGAGDCVVSGFPFGRNNLFYYIRPAYCPHPALVLAQPLGLLVMLAANENETDDETVTDETVTDGACRRRASAGKVAGGAFGPRAVPRVAVDTLESPLLLN